MSVLQIIKDLIGEEDISWGDSDSTFTRQTHTGGSTSIHYIDSKSIPANTLGGVVDSYLHTQNTDTGTTQTTFVINSGGNAATLSTTGLTSSGTYTFPTSAGQALAGSVDLASTSASKGASLIGVQDAGAYFSGTDVEAVLQELGADVAATTTYRGYKRGFKLGYSSTTAVTIGGGMWDHRGTSNQAVYTTSQLTFTLGSGGSNADSTNLGANEIHYIYIDDSAVVSAGTSLLTATEFVNSTTAPSWDHSKQGWYNGSDRCIGAVLTDGSNQILDFYVRSGVAYYVAPVEEYSSAAAPTSATSLDVSSSVPAFSMRAIIRLQSVSGDKRYEFNVESASEGMSTVTISTANGIETLDVPLASDQTVYWIVSAASDAVIDIQGYYIDEL